MTVELTHRRCSESLKETRIDIENLEKIESSNWENNEANIWEKTIKVKVLKKTEQASIITEREFTRDGGFGELTLVTSKQ